jgi:hypothetical protein
VSNGENAFLFVLCFAREDQIQIIVFVLKMEAIPNKPTHIRKLDPAFNESVLPRQVSLQSNQKL